MKVVTLVFLRDRQNNQILLALKKRGFGAGNLNGVGGKLDEGERVERAAVRETYEEVGVTIQEEDLQKAGHILFHFLEHPDWDLDCHVFFIEKWNGEPTESEEMAPRWFSINEIPLKRMWVDDQYWLERALKGEYIDATFYFAGDGERVERSVINGTGTTYDIQ